MRYDDFLLHIHFHAAAAADENSVSVYFSLDYACRQLFIAGFLHFRHASSPAIAFRH